MKCNSSFRTDNYLKRHQEQKEGCDLRNGQLIEGLDQGKIERLKDRKIFSGMDEMEKWRAVYRILFPNEDVSKMPSPSEYALP